MSNIISFQSIDSSTSIKQLPEIINTNNNYINDFCSSVFHKDSDNKIKLISSVNTTGNVKANSGYFENIYFAGLIGMGDTSIFMDITTDHNKSKNRFRGDYDKNITSSYTHDANSILFVETRTTGTKVTTVYDKIISYDAVIQHVEDKCDLINSSIAKLTENYEKLSEKLNIQNQVVTTDETEVMPATYSLRRSMSSNNNENNNDNDLVYTYNQNPNSYTYSNKIYSSSDISQCIYEWDKYDITSNNKFRYYKITDNYYTKINNQYKCALNTNNVGQETTLIIDKMTDDDLYIRLSFDGSVYEYAKIKNGDIDLARITLVCIKNTIYGPIWYIKNYNGNITLEKIEK